MKFHPSITSFAKLSQILSQSTDAIMQYSAVVVAVMVFLVLAIFVIMAISSRILYHSAKKIV
jgi:hypothetical protein